MLEREKPMYHCETGVLEQSEIYFHTPGIAVKNTFFYLLSLGHFWCNRDYRIKRNNFEQFLVIYVKNGAGIIESCGQSRRVKAGDLVFMDCYAPHSYCAQPEWEICWFHLDGTACRGYYEQIRRLASDIVSLQSPYLFELAFGRMMDLFQKQQRIPEYLISKYITDILTLFFQNDCCFGNRPDLAQAIEEVSGYICGHLDEAMDLDRLALKCSLSRYHFIRVFKKQTGYTPHEFIIRSRIDRAKYYLQTTDLTVKEISLLCGFQNESSFCTCFKKEAGQTPSGYRRYDNKSVAEEENRVIQRKCDFV